MSKEYFDKLDTKKLKKLQEVKLEGLKKIQLNLTQDAQVIIDELDSTMNELEEITRSLEKCTEEYSELERKTNTYISTATQLIKQANDLQADGISLYRDLESSAEELGIDVGDIKVAMELDTITVIIDDVRGPAEDAMDEVKSYMP